MSLKIDIGIVEDNSFLLTAIKEKLSLFNDIRVSFTARNGVEAVNQLQQSSRVDLVIMDIEMPKMNGIEATQKIKSLYPQIKILMLTVFDNDENIFNSIQAGADGYLLKEVEPQILYKSIQEVLSGGAAMNPSIALKTLQLLRNPPLFADCKEEVSLTKREVEVLEQISKGLSYTSIADNLFVSPATIRKHTENIYQKLQVHSKLEAIEKAKRNRLI